ncbi:Thioredoxin-like-fold domain-containing protein [Mycena chlorophos]|uniref:Thioredoxin-like-fold domain-containing protein n=1 Tax=Mycena chlorophos TaxID=658473 RepID=A0A8H6TH93_MYCCL|nr:Thioredoxin-like-fold domain-containing protein [Mycena chlorophos]
MALQPSLRPLIIAGPADAPHTLDIFLDYACPFSAKIALVMDKVLLPALGPGGNRGIPARSSSSRLGSRPHASPHPSSGASPSSSSRSTTNSRTCPARSSPPTQIRAKIAQLAVEGQVLPAENVAAFAALLEPKADLRGSNEVTEEVKYTLKFSRQNSIHVSPTVLWDGLVAPEVSSSWGEKEWDTFFQAKVLV